jgi:preprotein translocase subunit SecA
LDAEDNRVDFEDLLDEQRDVMAGLRSEVDVANPRELILEDYTNQLLSEVLERFAPDPREVSELENELEEQFGLSLKKAGIRPLLLSRPQLKYTILQRLRQEYESNERILGAETMRYHERMVMLTVIDELWKKHEESMKRLAEPNGSQTGEEQHQPTINADAAQILFEETMRKFRSDSVRFIFRMQIVGPDGNPVQRQPEIPRPSARSLLSPSASLDG